MSPPRPNLWRRLPRPVRHGLTLILGSFLAAHTVVLGLYLVHNLIAGTPIERKAV